MVTVINGCPVLQYFASGLVQKGLDSEGIHGFLFSDIRSELRRASKLVRRRNPKKGRKRGGGEGGRE